MHHFNFCQCCITNCTSWQSFHWSYRLNYILECSVTFSVSKRELSSFPQLYSCISMSVTSLVRFPIYFLGSLPRSPSQLTLTNQAPITKPCGIHFLNTFVLFPILITTLLIKVLIISHIDCHISLLETSSFPHIAVHFSVIFVNFAIWCVSLDPVHYLSGWTSKSIPHICLWPLSQPCWWPISYLSAVKQPDFQLEGVQLFSKFAWV